MPKTFFRVLVQLLLTTQKSILISMHNKFLIIAIATVSLLSACSNRIYFTEDTKLQLERSKVDMSKIQFYNSEPIVLARQIKKEEVEVVSGKVKLEKGKYIEEIVINRNTPGVFIEKNDKVFFSNI